MRARTGGLLDGWLVDTEDAGEVERIEAANIAARSVPLYMRDAATTRQLAVDALDLATDAGRPFMTLTLEPVDGIGEIEPGDDLAALVVEHATLADDDVVVITSKIVSKAAGLAADDKERLVDEQTDRVVATRGGTRIVRTHHGLTLAAAGVDGSNVDARHVPPTPARPGRLGPLDPRRPPPAQRQARRGGHQRHRRTRLAARADRHRDRLRRPRAARPVRRARRTTTETR